jgi:hypothetical protein
MPTYSYRCPDGHTTLMMVPVSLYQPTIPCGECEESAERIYTAPILVKVASDVQYTSPITGIPIQSHAARREDMARHGCVEYDPEMKKDVDRRREESMQRFEAAIEQTVCEEIAKMPSEKRAKLASEVIDQGLSPEPVRLTPEMGSI